MRALLIAATVIALCAPAEARLHHKSYRTVIEPSYPAPYWTYQKPVPSGAYQTTVTYGPGNRRCLSQLVLLPNGFWRPTRRCEIVTPG
jgi:hypothetical protein